MAGTPDQVETRLVERRLILPGKVGVGEFARLIRRRGAARENLMLCIRHRPPSEIGLRMQPHRIATPPPFICLSTGHEGPQAQRRSHASFGR